MLGCVEGVKSVLQKRKSLCNVRDVNLLFHKIQLRYSVDKVSVFFCHRYELQNSASLQSL